MSGPPGAFPVPSVGNKEIKKPCSNENRAKITLLTTYCCILTYEFPLTAESPGTLTFQKQYRFQGSASSSGVIFLSRKSTGLPSSPARFGFLLVNLLSPSWLFSMDRLNATIESVHSYIFLHSDKIMMLGSKGLLPPLIPDCFALRASTILKTFIIRSFFYEKWLLIHVLGGSQGQKSSCKQACIRFPTF